MKLKVNYLLFIGALGIMALMSCKKEKIEIPVSNDPVFRMDGTFGTESFSMVAGDNNAYMYTMTESVNGVNLFSGKLSDGAFSIEFGIFDGLIDKPNSIAISEITSLSPIFSSIHGEPLMVLSKDVLPSSQNIQQIKWFVNGEFKGINNAQISEPGNYNVCAEVTFWDGSSAVLCNELIVGYSINGNCAIEFTVDTMGNLIAELDAISAPIDHVDWFIDEVQVVAASSSIMQTSGLNSLHNLKAVIHFENGAVRTKQALVDATNSLHNVHDFTNFESLAAVVVPQDFNVRIHVEHNGKNYMSEYSNNFNATLNLTGVEYYGKNSNNKDVYKITGNVTARVQEYNSTKPVDLSFNAIFGVEIP